MKKIRLPKSAVVIQAEIKLETLGQLLRYRMTLDQAVEREIHAVQAKWAEQVGAAKKAIDDEHKTLLKLMKDYRGELFDQGDQVKLENGILIHGKEDKVQIPRDAIPKIEAQGWNEAIVITKSVDRAVVDQWPIERLALIGANRKPVESFDYEIADDPRKTEPEKRGTGETVKSDADESRNIEPSAIKSLTPGVNL